MTGTSASKKKPQRQDADLDVPKDTAFMGVPLLAPSAAAQIDDLLATGGLVGGWLIIGPPQIGKRTLATSLARALLSGGQALATTDPGVDKLIAHRAHPDFSVVERIANEKTGRLKTDIGVDQVRALTGALQRTATNGRRVAIIDTADELGREASNALLKTLEEPPSGTTIFLLSAAPGKVLPTIRSRCRRLSLPPVSASAIEQWLVETHHVDGRTAGGAAAAANGRPGAALSLTDGEGDDARRLAAEFWAAVGDDTKMLKVAAACAHRDHDAAWSALCGLIVSELKEMIRQQGGALHTRQELATLEPLLAVHDDVQRLVTRGAALNADKQHLVLEVARQVRRVKGAVSHAGG